MISGVTLSPLFVDVNRRLNDGPCLHRRNFRIRNRKAASTVAEHRVKLVQVRNRFLPGCRTKSPFPLTVRGYRRRLSAKTRGAAGRAGVSLPGGRPAPQTDLQSRRAALAEACRRFLPLLERLCHNHLAYRRDSVLVKEHVLRPAKSDTLRAEAYRRERILRRVCVRANLQPALFVRPAHMNFAKVARERRLLRCDCFRVNVARRAVKRDVVALAEPRCPAKTQYFSSSFQPNRRSLLHKHVPMPRATTAACEVMPLRAVRIPSAAFTPSMSSGEGLEPTSTTFSPRSPAASTAVRCVKVNLAARRARGSRGAPSPQVPAF